MRTAAEMKVAGKGQLSGTYVKPGKVALATVGEAHVGGNVTVFSDDLVSPSRRWFGVAGNDAKILYVRAADEAAFDAWLVRHELATIVPDEQGVSVLALNEGITVDRLGPVMLEPPVYGAIPRGQDFPAVVIPAVFDTGYHVNILLKG